MNREFDIILFGATGYTGRYVIEEIARTYLSTNIKWAIAGRNGEKLKESLKIVQEYLGDEINIQGVTIVEADVKMYSSLSDMCKKAKLILNTVGPYTLYGEPVVRACIENGTHHVDLSGELKYLETMQAKYFDAARAKKIYVLQSCGFDSIPGDYGIAVMKENFPGDLNSVEYYFGFEIGLAGGTFNSGTFVSASHSISDSFTPGHFDKLLKENVFKEDLPESSHPLSWRFPPIFYSSEVKSWCLWFIGSDERNIKRSQMLSHEYLKERPVESHGYFQLPSLFKTLLYLPVGFMFIILSLFSFGRDLLAKYPSFFSAGLFSNEGPTRQQVIETSTKLTFIGEGWKDKLLDPTDKHTTKPDTKLKLNMSGPEPAYAFTSICMVQAAVTILKEADKMPLEGGVLTPGVAFAKTSLRKRLENRGIKFEFETC